MNPILKTALEYAKYGWPVLPLHSIGINGHCTCRNPQCSSSGKHPRTKHGVKDATCDENRIRQLFQDQNTNIGIATGKISGIFVVDIDEKNNGNHSLSELEKEYGQLPATARVLTGYTGSRHLYYKYSECGIGNKTGIREGIDIRSNDGYVVAPPSRHKSGRIYEWEVGYHPDDIPLAEIPAWLFGVIKNPSIQSLHSNGEDESKITEGKRNDTLFRLASSLRKNGLSVEAIEAVLEVENKKRCNPPLSEQEIKKIAKSASRYEATNKSIGEPIPLIREQKQSMEYPLSELGEILGSAAIALRNAVQAPGAICAQSLLACAAFLAQPHVNLVIDGRIMPASLFFLTIAESGDRKSAADKLALKMIHYFEQQAFEKYQKEYKEFEEKKRVYENNLKKRMNRKASEEEYPANKMPTPPINPMMIVQEPTYEGLFKHLITGMPSLGLFSDEGGRMLGGHGMNKDNVLKTIAGLSELWDGSPISRMRAGEGVEKLYDRRLSLHLLIQPIIAQKIFGNNLLEGQGFLARILAWHPETLAGTRFYKEIDASCEPFIVEFYNRVNELLNLPYPYHSEIKGQLSPRNISLSIGARKIFRNFHDDVEVKISPHGEFSSIKPFACKAAEIAARLALVLQFFHEPDLQEISEIWMKRGCALCTGYLYEANRLWGDNFINPKIFDAEKVRLWLVKRQIKTITGKELYQRGPSIIRSLEKAESIVKILVEHGYLRCLPEKSQSFATQTWEIVSEESSNF